MPSSHSYYSKVLSSNSHWKGSILPCKKKEVARSAKHPKLLVCFRWVTSDCSFSCTLSFWCLLPSVMLDREIYKDAIWQDVLERFVMSVFWVWGITSGSSLPAVFLSMWGWQKPHVMWQHRIKLETILKEKVWRRKQSCCPSDGNHTV